ncbi:MAG: T9SS type A sorting domain-containing protein, partial [Ignavibacteria bacterium]|nr:T9SS type A sorting domain-containing protein [Ignavibacteria bacterium]
NKIDNILNSNLLSGKHKVSYNLGSLPLGMYFVRLSSENTVLTQKVYVKE